MVGGIIHFKVTQVHSNELWQFVDCVKLDWRMGEPVGELSSGVELLCVANKNKLGFPMEALTVRLQVDVRKY